MIRRKPYFYYQDNRFMVEDVPVDEIIKETGTPTYIYSTGSFKGQLAKLQDAFKDIPSIICFSVKVCHNVNVIKFFVEEGCGLDIVSGGELFRALKSGADPKKIVYSGVAKTEKEIKETIEAGILMLNVESEQELERINKIGGELNKRMPVAIRVNPNIDAKTHPYITTGMKKNKFGIDHELVLPVYRKAHTMKNIEVVGIDCHIGSQLLDVTPYKEALQVIAGYVKKLRAEDIPIKYVDVGGGIGVPYKEDDLAVSAAEYANAITSPFSDIPGITFILEPGRFLAGPGGILVTRVQYTKENSSNKKFVIVDTGMHHLLRPPLYGGFHDIVSLVKNSGKKAKVDVVGPICESTDFLGKERVMDETIQDDLLAIMDVGAYCVVLASHYNSHALPAEVLVSGSAFKIIAKRERYEDMLINEVLE